MKAQFKILSGARAGQVETFRKAYVGLGRHPLSDVRFDAERDLDVSSRHAAIVRKPEGFFVQDLGSRNGTYVNGTKIAGEVLLQDGDILGFGSSGPTVEFRILEAGEGEAVSPAAEAAAQRISRPREVFAAARPSPPSPPSPPPPPPPPPRSSTAVRIAAEVARQTRSLRRTTKLLFGALLLTAAGFAGLQWQGARDRAQELVELQARADSLGREAQQLVTLFQTALQGLRDALHQSQAEVGRLRRELAAAGVGEGGDRATVARLRAELEAAERRQRGLIGAAGVDYRSISRRNQEAVAIVVVEFSDVERFSGTAFAVDSQGTLVTNRHVLVGEDGDRTPRRIAVKFSGSRQWFPGRLVGISTEADIGVLKVEVRGGTPSVAGLEGDRTKLQRGDPVAIIGYPLGLDLPMEGQGLYAVAEPTLTVGTVSKVLTSLVQVDGYGAPGSSGSPLFDRDGRVVALLYGGERSSQGKIVYGTPAYFIVDYLQSLGPTKK